MRYVITGGSGYLGSRIIEKLAQQEGTERVLITDVRPPRTSQPKTEYRELDVRDRRMAQCLADEKPDVLVHLAFVLNPIHDENLMYDIDVNGTQNVLDGAAAAGIEQVLVASSATAYGAWPENPTPIPEEQAVRGVPGFAYSRDKAEVDRMTQLWAAQNPERVTTIVRPSIIVGPNVDNFIIRGWDNYPFLPLLDGEDPPLQFMHEDDLVDAVLGLLSARKTGQYNLGADGSLRASECAALVGVKARSVNAKRFGKVQGALWKLHAPRVDAPPGMLEFIRYPWVVDIDKVKRELDWQPRHDSREAFKIAIAARGLATSPGNSHPS